MPDPRNSPPVITGSVEWIFSWARRSSLWWLQFGLACCGMEMVAAHMPRYDFGERFGMWFRPSPRQADLMIVAGTVTRKMAPMVHTLYHQMPDPKWVIAMGSCACTGGPFDTYAVVQGVDQVIPVDVYVPGCPPVPESLYFGIIELQNKIIKYERIALREGRDVAEADRRHDRWLRPVSS